MSFEKDDRDTSCVRDVGEGEEPRLVRSPQLCCGLLISLILALISGHGVGVYCFSLNCCDGGGEARLSVGNFCTAIESVVVAFAEVGGNDDCEILLLLLIAGGGEGCAAVNGVSDAAAGNDGASITWIRLCPMPFPFS